MAESGIYEIVNTVNGKRYVGSACNIKQRWRVHRSDLNLGEHHSRALQRAWAKYGAERFAFRVIELCSRDDLIEREQWYLDNSQWHYNCSPTAGSSIGVKRSAAFREHMRRIKTGVPLSPEHRAKISVALKGNKRLTPEQNAALQEAKVAALKGRPLSAEHRAKIGAASLGKKWPPEQGRKISAAKMGKPRPDMIGNKWGCKRP